jgi:hypothetical protein
MLLFFLSWEKWAGKSKSLFCSLWNSAVVGLTSLESLRAHDLITRPSSQSSPARTFLAELVAGLGLDELGMKQ